MPSASEIGQESQRRDPGAAAQGPQRFAVIAAALRRRAAIRRLCGRRGRCPPVAPEYPSARIQSSCPPPRTIAAVLTVLAAKQVCRGDAHRSPHRIRRPPGPRVEDVVQQCRAAAPPTANGARRGQRRTRRQRDRDAGSSAASWTSTCQPPSGAGPAVAMSPPRLTSTPQPVTWWARAAQRSAATALAVAPRSSTTPVRHRDDPVLERDHRPVRRR